MRYIVFTISTWIISIPVTCEVPPFQRLSILHSIQYYGNHCTENIDMADIKLHRYNAKMSYDVNWKISVNFAQI